MSYSHLWDETLPVGSATPANTIDSLFRSLKIDIRERMQSLGATNWATDTVVGFAGLLFEGTSPKIFGGTVSTRFRNIADTFDIFTVLDVGDISTYRDFTAGRDLIVTRNAFVSGNSIFTGATTFNGYNTLNGNTKQATGQFATTEYNAGNSGAAISIDWNNGNNQTVVLTANPAVLTLLNPVAGSVYCIKCKNDATVNRTPTWPANVFLTNNSGSAMIQNSAPNYSTLYLLFYDGVNYYTLGSGTGSV